MKISARRLAGVLALSMAASVSAGDSASKPAATAPSPERIAELAIELASRWKDSTVALADGSTEHIVSTADSPGILTVERIEQCLATIGEAESWPSAWLVVQDASRPYDLVLRLTMDEAGGIAGPDPVFTATRREWDADEVVRAARAATGKKPPRERAQNVVVQGFTQKETVTYVYEPPPPAARAKGLMALLPPGAILRDAVAVDLGDGTRHTLAIVLEDARFEPSACQACEERLRGHQDTGRITLVLAGEKAIEERVNLTPVFEAAGVTPWLPRYACAEGDDDPAYVSRPPSERFRGREPIQLLTAEDLDGDGHAREFRLPLRSVGCERIERMTLAIQSAPPRLRVLPR